MLQTAGWTLQAINDLSPRYETWYGDLVNKIQAKRGEIVSLHGERWFEYALKRYQDLLDVMKEGIIGGAIVTAVRA
jgi:hypothetical protein